MRMTYLSKIQTNLTKTQFHTRRVTSSLFDGSYRSIYKGRSLDFDELREYVIGDEVKDIDWKASARGSKLLVKKYIAEKKHNLMLIMDTNRRMKAYATDDMEKSQLAYMYAGTLGFLVNRNGDYVSATFCSEKGMQHFPFKSQKSALEGVLSGYDRATTPTNTTDVTDAIDYVLKIYRRRMIVLIVTDMTGISRIPEATLKRLLVRNDVLFVNTDDIAISGSNLYDIEKGEYLPAFFTRNKKLTDLKQKKREEIKEECMDKLNRLGISCITVSDIQDLDLRLMELIERHGSR